MSAKLPVGDLNITIVNMCLECGVCLLRMKNDNQSLSFYMMKSYVLYWLKRGTVFGSNIANLRRLKTDINLIYYTP